MMDLPEPNLNIAPCGMNCGVCMAFLRTKNRCPGCRSTDLRKAASVLGCKIKNCEHLNSEFCHSCLQFPCKRIKHIDQRYRAKYGMSMIENLESIRDSGLTNFIHAEKARWTCPNCNGTICVHKGRCIDCGAQRP